MIRRELEAGQGVRLLGVPAGMLAHTGEGVVTLHLEGEIEGVPVELAVLHENHRMEFRVPVGKLDLFVPLLAPGAATSEIEVTALARSPATVLVERVTPVLEAPPEALLPLVPGPGALAERVRVPAVPARLGRRGALLLTTGAGVDRAVAVPMVTAATVRSSSAGRPPVKRSTRSSSLSRSSSPASGAPSRSSPIRSSPNSPSSPRASLNPSVKARSRSPGSSATRSSDRSTSANAGETSRPVLRSRSVSRERPWRNGAGWPALTYSRSDRSGSSRAAKQVTKRSSSKGANAAAMRATTASGDQAAAPQRWNADLTMPVSIAACTPCPLTSATSSAVRPSPASA